MQYSQEKPRSLFRIFAKKVKQGQLNAAVLDQKFFSMDGKNPNIHKIQKRRKQCLI
jgi:hypothetical protein